MNLKAIDVSSNQGKPDWTKVSKSGVKAAILRIHQKTGIDASFEHNYKGCKSNSILVGGYKYSYALTPAQAVDEAENVIAALAGRGLDFPIFYDLEWDQQWSLGKQAIENIAVSFLTRIKKAGYKAGIYCNTDWYNSYLPDNLKKYDIWLANYPDNDTGTIQERLRPSVGVGWQYSECGKVSGISGKVDMNVFYTDYRDTDQSDKKGEANTMTMVKISNCGHDENGRYAGGKAGDQTGTEYQIMNWYSRPWMCVLRFKNRKAASLIADMAKKAALNNLIGYDQGTVGNSNDRYTFWQHLKASNYDPAQITVSCETDCSASTAAIIKGAGYRLNLSKLKSVSIYLTTHNMRQALKNAGAKVLTDKKYLTSGDYLKAGDILLNDNHHVAIAVTSGSKSTNTSATTKGANYMFEPNLVKLGSEGASVLLLQEILISRGFKGKNGKALTLSRKADENTIYALTQYQKSRNGVLVVDGECGANTWKDLIAI